MRLLPANTRTASPWKNGGGLTTEVAASPDGAGFDAFDWRVSLAEVTTSGPFSSFPGIDRWLLVLEGSIRLTIEGLGDVTLSAGEHLAFPGDAATHGEVLNGPVRDLNLMTRRDRLRAEALRLDQAEVGGGDQLLLALGAVRIGDHDLAPLDAVILTPDDTPRSARGSLVLVTFETV